MINFININEFHNISCSCWHSMHYLSFFRNKIFSSFTVQWEFYARLHIAMNAIKILNKFPLSNPKSYQCSTAVDDVRGLCEISKLKPLNKLWSCAFDAVELMNKIWWKLTTYIDSHVEHQVHKALCCCVGGCEGGENKCNGFSLITQTAYAANCTCNKIFN